MKLEIPELEEISEKLDALIEGRTAYIWLTLEQAYQLKFGRLEKKTIKNNNTAYKYDGPSFLIIKKNPAYQPAGGIPDGWHVNKKLWKRETVERWLLVTDENLEEYLNEVAPGTRLPDGFKHRSKDYVDWSVLKQVAL